ncbi:MAG: SDR family oxidoreductase [Deltaproteobacteria bacterium]|nr:SDR family oxidoreductase [Deltaproteobacteria bacterium]MBW2396900.1 SDR family oxidoreductase [Deltaproteobacteria bacterium]
MAFDIDGSVVLITGGNAGIGKATAIELARRGAQVTITSRDPERGKLALDEIRQASGSDGIERVGLDLASLASVRRCAEEFLEHSARLDVLINNAGINLIKGVRQLTHDGFEMHFGVNHLGHFLLTDLLLDRLKASAPARIVNLASHGYMLAPEGLDFDDLQMERAYNAFTCYGHSKLANIQFTLELAKRLEGTGVTANAVHPGYVKTELGRRRPEDKQRFAPEPETSGAKKASSGPDLSKLPPPVSADEGAETSIYLAADPACEGVTGEYFADSQRCELSPVGADADAAARLWAESESLIASVS